MSVNIVGVGPVPHISAVSRLRAAAGDGNFSAETLAAIAEGAIPPPVIKAADKNAEAVLTGNTPRYKPLREIASEAKADAGEVAPSANTVATPGASVNIQV